MRLLLALGVLVGSYMYVMLHTTDIVLGQVQHIQSTYQYVGDNAESIALGE